MAYEWDQRQAARERMWKLASVVAGTLITVGIPTAIVLAAMGN
ncbi:hypothetical protein [Mycoplana sp. MJR14]|jgi:hypothetical protein|nr:hypothetical protein [Mycoplana sp. MJR14]MDF1635277.1 hypothetical protein [Mycoplana sp. MJR14]